MKVLLFRTNGNVLDINKYNSQEIGLAKALIKKGFDCDIAYFNDNKTSFSQQYNINDVSITIHWLKGFSIAGNGFFYKLNSFVSQYDIIQVSEYDQLTSIFLAFFSKYRERVIIYHGPYISEYNKKYRLKCRLIDLLPLSKKRKKEIICFAKSSLAMEFLQKRKFSNVVITGVGLDVDRLIVLENPSEKTNSILREMNSNLNLLYIGNIEPRRNTIFLINLMKEIVDVEKGVKLVIVGGGDSSYVKLCEETIKKHNLTNFVKIFDRIPQNEISKLYKKADMFLLPTSYEIYGMVMMEAMYYKIPVLTTKSGGSLTVIENNKNGLIKDLDIDIWKNEILRLLKDSATRNCIGENARSRIMDCFTWDRIACIMSEAYKNLNKNL